MPDETWSWIEYIQKLQQYEKGTFNYDTFCEDWELHPSQLGDTMNRRAFEDFWDRVEGPLPQAYRLLKKLDLGPDFARSGRQAGSIDFIEGGHPGDDSLWVEIPDELSLSLLQARLIEMKLPIKVEVAEFG